MYVRVLVEYMFMFSLSICSCPRGVYFRVLVECISLCSRGVYFRVLVECIYLCSRGVYIFVFSWSVFIRAESARCGPMMMLLLVVVLS